MNNQKLRKILSLAAFVVVVGAIGYYVWSQNIIGGLGLMSDFKVVDKSLSEEEIDHYRSEFLRVTDLLAQKPDDFYLSLELGMIKKYIGDYQGAADIWIKVGELEPKNSTSFGNLADLYANFLNDNAKAEVAYQAAISRSFGEELNINYYRNYYDFARHRLQDGDKAEEILLTALEKNPESSELAILLAQYYADNGDKAKALEYYQLALKFDPTDDLVREEINKLR